MSVAFGPLAILTVRSLRAYSAEVARCHTIARANLALDRVASEIGAHAFQSSSLSAGAVSPTLTLQSIADVTYNGVVYGNPIKFQLQAGESDSGDGVDNDGDGFTDESTFIVWEDVAPTGTSPGQEDPVSSLCSPVAPNGLTFTRVGDQILVQLTFQSLNGDGNGALNFTLETTVNLKNLF